MPLAYTMWQQISMLRSISLTIIAVSNFFKESSLRTITLVIVLASDYFDLPLAGDEIEPAAESMNVVR